jgi:transcriptional regulator with XRE-family HTH domain
MFGKRLKKLRQNAQLTQQQLADSLGITQAAITRYEREVQEPIRDVIIRTADYFNVTTDYLLGRTNRPNFEVRTDLPDELKNSEILGYTWPVGEELTDEDIEAMKLLSRLLTKLRRAGTKSGEGSRESNSER